MFATHPSLVMRGNSAEAGGNGARSLGLVGPDDHTVVRPLPFAHELPPDGKGCSDAAYSPAGKVTVIVVPSPSRLSSSMLAWWNAAECLTMARPRPVPPLARERLVSTR